MLDHDHARNFVLYSVDCSESFKILSRGMLSSYFICILERCKKVKGSKKVRVNPQNFRGTR